MKRRKFIKNLSFAGGGAISLAGIPMKLFAQKPQLLRAAAGSNNNKVLVILQMHGGNDGLNTLIPVEQYDLYYSRRANIAIPAKNSVRSMIPLDGTLPFADQVGLHPDMQAVKKLYDQGRAAFIQGVSYKHNNGSHFRGRDIWFMGGGSEDYYSSGWVGRYLQELYTPKVYPDDFPNPDTPDPLAIEMGSDVSLIFHQDGNIPTSISLGSNPQSLSNLIEGLEGFDDEGLDPRGTPPSFLSNSPYGKEMSWLLNLEDKTEDYAARLLEVYQKASEGSVVYPETYPFNAPRGSLTNRLTPQLKLIARLLDGGGDGVCTKVFLIKIGGFDTHAEQVESYDPTMGVHSAKMYHIATAMEAFQKDLRERGIEDRVLTVTTSEFGRRIASNGSYGTDHGTGGPVMLFGAGVNPGVVGTNPDVSKHNVDLQFDYRQVFANIVKDWLEVDEEIITEKIFFGDFINGPNESGGFYKPLPIISDKLITSNSDFISSRFRFEPLYPNPAENIINVNYYINSPGPLRLRLLDSQGRMIKMITSGHHIQGAYKVQEDISSLRPGSYIVQIEHSLLKSSQKFIKIR
jgi:uncharacterized protein (DUF1501 family)